MSDQKIIRCGIYTRKSSEEGLDQSFNSLHAQREACEAYVLSQKHEGWQILEAEYDDGGFSGGNMERPGLKRLLADISAKKIDTVVVYKVDRLTRSLADFAKIVEAFDGQGVSFVSVTQQFNTTTSMGRLTLNVLLSFAQFEREVTGERIRDKVAASKKKGIWMGGHIPLGYDLVDRQLIVNLEEATTVRHVFQRYLELGTVTLLYEELKRNRIRSKQWIASTGRKFGGAVFSRGSLYHLLSSTVYIGKTRHKDLLHEGQHSAIIDEEVWKKAAALLKENAVTRKTSCNVPTGRLLQAKLQTEDGRRYTPTHASKGGRRYFYYTLRGKTSARDLKRIPASEIETQTFAVLASYLKDQIRLAKDFPKLTVRELKVLVSAGAHQATLLQDGILEARGTFLSGAVKRVIVSDGELRLQLSGQGLLKQLLGEDMKTVDGESIHLAIPFTVARRGSEVRLLLAGSSTPLREPIPALVRAVTQARTWSGWILAGEVSNLNQLAQRAGMTTRYASRILRLAALSPSLCEDILGGNHSPTLTVVKLTERVPLDWSQQMLPS